MIQAKAKIKLLIVVPTLECGGLERNVAIICNNFNTTKYDVTLAILNNQKQFFHISNKNIHVIDLQIANVRKSLFRILNLSKKIRPDIILSTANHLNLLFAIFKWIFPKGIKIIARESSIVSINTQGSWSPVLFNWLLKNFYKKLDLIVCQSEYMQLDLVKNYHIIIEKTRIINNPVSIPILKTDSGEKRSFPDFITVARLSKEKGIDRLIRALAKMDIPFRFTIIGEGVVRNSLQDLIESLSMQNQVTLAGNKENPFAEISSPDLFLMGSYYEGFPNAMLEAMAAGIPVIAFNAPGGIAEIIIQNENGILVNGDDEQAFADAIKRALNKGFDKKQIQENILKKYNVNAIIDQWDDLFGSLKQ